MGYVKYPAKLPELIPHKKCQVFVFECQIWHIRVVRYLGERRCVLSKYTDIKITLVGPVKFRSGRDEWGRYDKGAKRFI